MRCEQCGKETVNNTRCSHCGAVLNKIDPFSTLGDLVLGATDEKKSNVIDKPSTSTTHKDYFSELGDIIIRRKPGKGKDTHYPVNTENYPWFERSEFVGTQLRNEPYVIERLPEIGATPSINWVQVLSAPVAMLMIAFILMAAGMSNMLMMLPMQLVGVVTAVISYYSQKKKYKKNSNDREVKYKDYLAEAETDLEEIAQNQKKTMWESNPQVASSLGIIQNRDGILWSRYMQSKDFLEIPIGVGQSDLSCPIDVHRPGRFDNDVNDLSLRAAALADRYKQIQGVPINFSLLQNNSIAVVGNREHRTASKGLNC